MRPGPFFLPDRSARSQSDCGSTSGSRSQSGDLSPFPLPSTGWLLLMPSGSIYQVAAPVLSSTVTSKVTLTILWFGGHREAGEAVAATIAGGVRSSTGGLNGSAVYSSTDSIA